jgi:hypothetical protein
MRKTVVGFFDSYGKALDVVLDLEHIGIVGTEVEVVTRVEDDVRDISAHPAAVRPSKERIWENIAQLFLPKVSQGQAMIIVRTADERAADRASEILRLHHSKGVTQRPGATFVWEDERPEFRAVKELEQVEIVPPILAPSVFPA